MGDLFHETVKFEWIDQIIGMISDNPQYTFIFLTKRPERCLEFFKWFGNEIKRNGFDSVPTQSDNPLDYYDPLPNIWIGVTVENQEQTKRIDELIKIPAAVHFISVEPMLENLNLEKWLSPEKSKIDWVICGAETGRKSRYMNPAWVRSLRDQCKESGVPFFMKKMSNKEEIPEDLLIREFPII
jgi:protein gp37